MTPAITSSAAKTSNYIPSLDGIRACAFLIVFLAHAIPGRLGTYIPATFGVTVFFFLSGYLITTLLRREYEEHGSISLKKFYIRRSLRILPPMYVAYGVTFILASLGLLAEKGNIRGFIASLGYYYNYSQLLATHVNVPTGMTVLWSLSIEEHFYFIFPVGYLLLIRKRVSPKHQSVLFTALCFVGLLWRVFLTVIVQPPTLGHLSWTYAATDARFDSLLWGCLLAAGTNPVFDDRAEWLKRYSGYCALAGLAMIAVSMLFREPLYREAFRYTLQGAGLYPVFYYCVQYPHQVQVRWLEWTPLRWIGWLSYSLYLIHNAFLLQLHLEFPNNLLLDGVIAFTGSVLYAWLVRSLVELPLRRVRKYLDQPVSLARRDTESVA